MSRYFCAIILVCVLGCADRGPTTQEVLEQSRKTTAEVEQKVEAIQKSTEQAVQKGEEIKQRPADSADPKFN